MVGRDGRTSGVGALRREKKRPEWARGARPMASSGYWRGEEYNEETLLPILLEAISAPFHERPIASLLFGGLPTADGHPNGCLGETTIATGRQ